MDIDEQTMKNYIDDLECLVYYDYQPYEPPVYYPIERAYPGCDAQAILNAVVVNNVDILNHLSTDIIKKFALDAVENGINVK